MRKLYVPVSAVSDIDHESIIRDLHEMGAETEERSLTEDIPRRP